MIANKQLSNVEEKKTDWLWQPLIAFGTVTVIQGAQNTGKTSLLIKMMADLSRGIYPPTMRRGHLYEREMGEPVKIYYVSAENNMNDMVAPFFDLCGGDRHFVEYQDEKDGHFVLSGEEIRSCIEMTGARVIIVDPWRQFVDSSESIAEMIENVQKAAEETGAAVILADRYELSEEEMRALHTLLTMKVYEGESVNENEDRTIETTKMNMMGKEVMPAVIRQRGDSSLKYVDYPDMKSGKEIGLGRIINGVYMRPDEKYVPDSEENTTPSYGKKAMEAIRFLRRELSNGPIESNEMKKLINESGISMPTILRAKEAAGVISVRIGKHSVWQLKGE